MTVGAIILVAFVLGPAVLAVPVLVMLAATRGGPNLARIVTVVAGLALVVAALWVAAALLALASDTTRVDVPVSPTSVRLPAGVTVDATATFQSGDFDRLSVWATGLPLATRLVLAAAPLLSAATTAAVALVVLRLVRSMREGDPFALGSRALRTTGWIVLIGGSLATWVGNVGDWMASRDLFQLSGWSGVGTTVDVSDLSALGWPDAASLSLELPWAALTVGIVLALLAAVFRHGERLRSDAEGLV